MKRILLFIICCYAHTDITPQILAEQSEETLLEQAETFIKFSQQAGLFTSISGQLDSMRISRVQEDTEDWEAYRLQQNYYQDQHLGKQLLLEKLDNETAWTRQQLREYHYEETILKRQFLKKWDGQEWKNENLSHLSYNTEQQLVKTYQQQWSIAENNWQTPTPNYFIQKTLKLMNATQTTKGKKQSFDDWFEGFRSLVNLIKAESTGTASDIACTLGVSLRTVRRYMTVLRDDYSEAHYCRKRRTYYFTEDVVLLGGWVD